MDGGMSGQRNIENLALIGFMGTGKSSVGRLAAAQLHFRFVDTDEQIERGAGKSISRIFAEEGEPAFRALEAQVVEDLGRLTRCVISTGGGLGANPAHLASLKQHALTVCLWARPDAIWRRVRYASHRPLVQGPDAEAKIQRLLEERSPVYREADVLINTELRSLRDVTRQVLHQFRLACPVPRKS